MLRLLGWGSLLGSEPLVACAVAGAGRCLGYLWQPLVVEFRRLLLPPPVARFGVGAHQQFAPGTLWGPCHVLLTAQQAPEA